MYICILSNKSDLKQTIRVLHMCDLVRFAGFGLARVPWLNMV
jgi:hypothetical protein